MKASFHRKRLRAERRFIWYGRTAMGVALTMLAVLLLTLFSRSADGFSQIQLRLPVTFDREILGDLENAGPYNYEQLAQQALFKHFPQVPEDNQRLLLGLLPGTSVAGLKLRAVLMKHPEYLGNTVEVWVPAASAVDLAYKDNMPAEPANLTEEQYVWVKALHAEGRIKRTFNTTFFSEGDSREPQKAGFMGAIIGSLLTIAVCLSLAFPLGVATAVYLQECAKRSRLTDIIEVNINNLAAVPSIVFGLLGLSVYLGMFGMPRSAPVVGGLTLALMILPVIIIATRSALAAVPDSIRHAALAMGASPLQVVCHHTLPLAMPGIMTGTILGVARALGETAPLLMIGMVAFVADIPHGFLSSATVMPVQVYLWAGSPEAGFAEKTAAGIIVLLAILLALNALAIYIRKRFEVRW